MQQKVTLVFVVLLVIAGCKKNSSQSTAVVNSGAATNITSTSAQVGGAIVNNGGSEVTQSGICWAFNNSPTLNDSIVTAGVSSGSFTISLSGLNSHTEYYYRAYAVNGSGTGYGSVDSFVTSNGIPTVTTVAITNNEALVAQSGGNVVNNGGATILARGVCWSTSINPTLSNSKTVDSPGTGSFTDTITNLTLGSTYYVRAYATNSYGTAYGNQVTFTVSTTGTVSDIDGNVYGTITIGTQTWTTSNLKVSHYNNGDPITDGLTGYNWFFDSVGAQGVYTFPNGDTANNALFGKYYSVGAVNDPRSIAPAGWHVATDQDWYTLEFYEGLTASDTASNPGDDGLRGSIGGKLLVGGSSGLNLQLAGYLIANAAAGDYQGFGQLGVYWSSTLNGPDPYGAGNWGRGFNVNGAAPIYRTVLEGGLSVRCVKN